jgi:O-acetyl-ADP-ribose deacetylase (regulator of RNase III)
MKYIDGDLIELAKQGMFDVIAHGANCFCVMGSGIAPQMAKAFKCDIFPMESNQYRGDINKLGTIDYAIHSIFVKKPINYNGAVDLVTDFGGKDLYVINAYTQYRYGRNHEDGDKSPVDYEAITLCMRKINHLFKGKTIGLPKIGAGLAGGDWNIISKIIERELKDMNIIIVNYKP